MMAWLRTQLARAGSAILLAIAATPTVLDPIAFGGGLWWDPSGALALPPVQNAICQESGAFCKRQNQIRLDTLDYRASFGNPTSVPAASGNDGWHAFMDLDPIYGDENCINYKRINHITRIMGHTMEICSAFRGTHCWRATLANNGISYPITDWVSAKLGKCR